MHPIQAFMAGTVWKILVQPGDFVTVGQEVVILESMKMNIPVAADIAGTVMKIAVNEGDFVNEGDVLLELR